MLRHPDYLIFVQDWEGLKAIMPAERLCDIAHALKIARIKLMK